MLRSVSQRLQSTQWGSSIPLRTPLSTLITPERRKIIDATAPVVAENIMKITPEFYKTMFANEPSVLNFFNQSNQRSARQPRALADSVLAAVGHLDNLSAINPALATAVHKHCALGVLDKHYQIVHDNFLEATAKVLGDAVTPEVADAWSAVLMHVAGHFIGLEKELYAATTAQLDNWDSTQPQEFVVAAKNIVSDRLAAVDLERADGGKAPPYTPGQYVTLCENPTEHEFFAPRHYTVAAPAPIDNRIRVCVKNVDGVMSNYVHGKLNVGDRVSVRPPFGVFTEKSADGFDDVVFITAGAGITPALAMLPGLSASKKRVVHYHIDDKLASVPYEEDAGLLDNVEILRRFDNGKKDTSVDNIIAEVKDATGVDLTAKSTVTMICAPPDMLASVRDHLYQRHGVTGDNFKFEHFGPKA